MDMLERSLDSASQEKQEEEVVQVSEDGTGEEQTAVAIAGVQQAAAFADHNVQYQFRTEGGQVTYRVVQVTDQQLDGRDDEGGAAVIQNPFSNGGSPVGDAVGGETRFAYFPAAAVSDGTVSVQAAADPTLTQAGGQFYVMMTPPDVIQTGPQRTIAPRSQPYPAKMDGPRTPRDERRRAQHNEVERRRRDKINNWIVTLSKIIPDCNIDSTKTGASKGGILSKACDYIRDLRQSNQRLQEGVKEVERMQVDNELCRQQQVREQEQEQEQEQEEAGRNDTPVAAHQDMSMESKAMPDHVRQKRQSHLSLCRWCCNCCRSYKGCGFCCKF